ncbi:MAG TPA: protealysin inhibitor emfourin [Gemmatimonadaceae bacterium]|nr:protealysin inhibitor emfourin [Gemmatimonadaceae bacterium]
MNIRSITLAVASISLMACTHHDPTTALPSIRNRDLGTLNGAKLELSAEGGIAALQTKYTVDHDTRVYAYSLRHICSDKCGAPMDTASGTLSPAAADSLFNLVLAESPYGLRDDYGTTPNAADMMNYALRVTFDGSTKTIRADDGTMPDAMRRIADSIRGVVTAARGK